MSSPLHKAPMGLLAALNLKVLGKNPDQFSDELAPTFNVNDLYTAEWIRQTENSAIGITSASSTDLDIDPGALWLLRNITAIWDYDSGCTSTDEWWRFSITYQSPGAPSQLTLAFEKQSVADLAVPLGGVFSQRLTFTPPHQMLFLPSTRFRAVASSVVTAAFYQAYIRAEFIPLKP